MTLDLGELFRIDTSPLELFVRATVVYLGLLAAMRVLSWREMGALEMPDMLVIVLIADGVQNGMSGAYQSVTGALIVGGTLLGWNYALDWLSYHVPAVRRLIRPRRLELVRAGHVLTRELRRALVTEDELRAQLRIQGVEDVREVKSACLEPQGELSVIRYDKGEAGAGDRGRHGPAGPR
jgi:uncharacterized membrane protein YcaP (DUF421 family)